jgi:hypothetical protein
MERSQEEGGSVSVQKSVHIRKVSEASHKWNIRAKYLDSGNCRGKSGNAKCYGPVVQMITEYKYDKMGAPR